MEDFDYGRLEIGHRLHVDRAIDHTVRVIEKGICVGLECKVRNHAGEIFWEVQVLYRDENGQSHCDCLPLDDYTVKIRHKGNMGINF